MSNLGNFSSIESWLGNSGTPQVLKVAKVGHLSFKEFLLGDGGGQFKAALISKAPASSFPHNNVVKYSY